jgi:hypothetical protein
MSIYKVEVDVALRRPPRTDATIYFTLDAKNGHAAELIACQWAYCHPRVVMPVGSVVTDWEEGAP